MIVFRRPTEAAVLQTAAVIKTRTASREDAAGHWVTALRLRAEAHSHLAAAAANWRCPDDDTWNGPADTVCICCDRRR